MSKTAKRSTILMSSLEEDAAIHAAALADPDAQALIDAQLKEMVSLRTLRGRPKAESTKQTGVGFATPPEVLAHVRATGEGWQARMDGVLRDDVAQHSR
jgi:uncharacterized protein (DUF4415 family)